MNCQLNEVEFQRALSLKTDRRYAYCIRKIAEQEQVWGLWREDGWALLEDPLSRMCIPIWPHEEFARACAEEKWQNYQPRLIDLQGWMTRWLPGLQKDGLAIAVFPTVIDKGMVISADKCRQDFTKELGIKL